MIEAAEGMDTIINLSVLRPHRRVAFDVNARGTYNACAAAVHHGIRRVINTGPHFTITGPTYENSDSSHWAGCAVAVGHAPVRDH